MNQKENCKLILNLAYARNIGLKPLAKQLGMESGFQLFKKLYGFEDCLSDVQIQELNHILKIERKVNNGDGK